MESKTLSQAVADLSVAERKQVIRDYETLESTAAIGPNALIRTVTEQVFPGESRAMEMTIVGNEVFRKEYYRLRETVEAIQKIRLAGAGQERQEGARHE